MFSLHRSRIVLSVCLPIGRTKARTGGAILPAAGKTKAEAGGRILLVTGKTRARAAGRTVQAAENNRMKGKSPRRFGAVGIVFTEDSL